MIGHYRLHYADGTDETVPIVDGEDLQEWIRIPGSKSELKRAKAVWEGRTPAGDGTLLFERTWENPHPEKEVVSLDFTSTETLAAPFLIAVTTEG